MKKLIPFILFVIIILTPNNLFSQTDIVGGEDADIQEMMGDGENPMEMMANIMKPENIAKMMKNIEQVMGQNIQDGNITEGGIKEEAQNMYGKISNNPVFSDLMQNMVPPQDGQPDPEKSKEVKKEKIKEKIKKKELSKEEKKERIRKKIKEKENERNKK